jgi:hypothetical protein
VASLTPIAHTQNNAAAATLDRAYQLAFYLTILHQICFEFAIINLYLKSIVSAYSGSFVQVLLCFVTLVLGGSRASFGASTANTQRAPFFILLLPAAYLIAITSDLFASASSQVWVERYALFWLRTALLGLVFFQAIYLRNFSASKFARPFKHFTIASVVCGFTLLLLYIAGLDPKGFAGTADFVNRNAIDRSTDGLAQQVSFYVFPFKLGLIAQGEDITKAFGLNFYRFSGWFYEPGWFAFYMVPAFILFLDSKKLLPVFAAASLILWSHSLTAFLIIAALGYFYIALIRPLWAVLIAASAIVAVPSYLYAQGISITDIFDTFSILQKLTSKTGRISTSYLLDAFSNFELLGRPFNRAVATLGLNYATSVFSLLAWSVVYLSAIFIGLRLSLTADWRREGFALLYLVGFSLKSVQHYLTPSMIMFVGFLILVRFIREQQDARPSDGHTDPHIGQ